jgi:uncharacterized YigZ family protein
MEPTYKTIETSNSAEFKDRGSKFIGLCFPVNSKDDFKTCMATVKDLHPKADHFCFAYRIGFDGDNYRSSDAGEPSGTAGKPILGQIDSFELTLIVVVRYFGGTLLGVPGLINAYKTTSSLLLQTTPIIVKERTILYDLEFDYTKLNDVMKLIKQVRASIVKNNSSLFTQYQIEIPLQEKSFFEENISRVFGITWKRIAL